LSISFHQLASKELLTNAYSIIHDKSTEIITKSIPVCQTQMLKAAAEHLDTLLPKAKEIENVSNMSAKGGQAVGRAGQKVEPFLRPWPLFIKVRIPFGGPKWTEQRTLV
jgi:hypothetical protein